MAGEGDPDPHRGDGPEPGFGSGLCSITAFRTQENRHDFPETLARIPAGASESFLASFLSGHLIPKHERSESSRFQSNPFEQDR